MQTTLVLIVVAAGVALYLWKRKKLPPQTKIGRRSSSRTENSESEPAKTGVGSGQTGSGNRITP